MYVDDLVIGAEHREGTMWVGKQRALEELKIRFSWKGKTLSKYRMLCIRVEIYVRTGT